MLEIIDVSENKNPSAKGLALLDSDYTIKSNIPFYNLTGSYYYIKLKVEIAKEYLFYCNGGLKVYDVSIVPDTLDSISMLSSRYNIPKSSISRALINIADDGGWIKRLGVHGRGVKYQIILTEKKAQDFLDFYSTTLKIQKSRKIKQRGVNGTNGIKFDIRKWVKTGT